MNEAYRLDTPEGVAEYTRAIRRQGQLEALRWCLKRKPYVKKLVLQDAIRRLEAGGSLE